MANPENKSTEEDKIEDHIPAEQQKSQSKLILILIIALVLLLLGAGVLGWLLFSSESTDPSHATASTEMPPVNGAYVLTPSDRNLNADANVIFVDLEKFIVNIRYQPDKGERTVLAQFSLKMDDPQTEAIVKSRIPEIRHVILQEINRRTFVELRNPEGKQKLCDDILEQVNILLDPKLAAMYMVNRQGGPVGRDLTGHDVETDTSGTHEGAANVRSTVQTDRWAIALPIQKVVLTNFTAQ